MGTGGSNFDDDDEYTSPRDYIPPALASTETDNDISPPESEKHEKQAARRRSGLSLGGNISGSSVERTNSRVSTGRSGGASPFGIGSAGSGEGGVYGAGGVVVAGVGAGGVSVRPPSGNAVRAANALRQSTTPLLELNASSSRLP